ncbi:hypothetical protein V1477_014787 [Vespula maculifrons]|uniref:Uncharacterized protein n=1 Tax=Vespula maculifrons TaxID=7453 RepID=A0ABD2BIF5_VESMC
MDSSNDIECFSGLPSSSGTDKYSSPESKTAIYVTSSLLMSTVQRISMGYGLQSICFDGRQRLPCVKEKGLCYVACIQNKKISQDIKP